MIFNNSVTLIIIYVNLDKLRLINTTVLIFNCNVILLFIEDKYCYNPKLELFLDRYMSILSE